METTYLECKGQLVGKEAESDRAASLADAPPTELLLTALVQPAAGYLCISPNYHRHTAPSIELLQESEQTKTAFVEAQFSLTLTKFKS